ncbi:TPA: hypothetical protein ACMU4L_003620 [Clostridioides difficile]|uniref:hypothetical protein n=1 Tax=Clostridioides difficile TaxID=1496 RepID=UPI00038D6A72|nr:hypothetical protein [Clostridioides difficile]EGT4167648.1 hypothetical protein [Clostridioides difficile]EGT4522161.1 hypothetical protein [Clostridioides difficile]EGT5104537.1 hypothetical protein [Clostridioides difficile]EGT5170278.1 hypothetical protein [Clostridioides difficile]EIS9734126.1 hypothetical protein [Clostridioides difficile]
MDFFKKIAKTILFLFFNICLFMFTIVGILAIQQKNIPASLICFSIVVIILLLCYGKKIKQISVLKIKENTKKDVNFDSENFQKQNILNRKSNILEQKEEKQKMPIGCIVIILFAILLISLTLYTFTHPEEFNTEPETKISKDINLIKEAGFNEEEAKNISDIMRQCGIEGIDSISNDSGLDNAHFDGEKGYRIEFGGSKNIILYLNKDNSVYNVRWADNDFYKNGRVVSKVSDYTLTMDEKTALQLQCQNGVSAILKSPSTAKFPNITKWMFSKNKEEIVVQSYVDSQNSLGATMRSEFQIIFTSDGKDVKSFVFDGKEMIK